MKTFTGKTQEEALEKACEELGLPLSEIIYKVQDKKVGIFSKKYAVDVYELSDVIKYAEDYILGIIDALGIESSPHTRLDDDIIRITIDSTHNPILIGKNGRTLQALNELTKLAVSSYFHKRFRILLDINGYKDNKYGKLRIKENYMFSKNLKVLLDAENEVLGFVVKWVLNLQKRNMEKQQEQKQ